MAHPSGEQWQIEHGDLVAVVTEVGGGLRSLRLGDLDVVAGYEADEMASSGRGQVLVPWPNRLRDGRYEMDGTTHELPITEPETGNASHGLTRWEGWRLRERHDDAVVVSAWMLLRIERIVSPEVNGLPAASPSTSPRTQRAG